MSASEREPRSGAHLHAEADVADLFATRQRARLAGFVSAKVIDEHRANPIGNHSPDLTMLLIALRQAPVAGKLALLETRAGEEWMVVRLSGEHGVRHDVSEPERYRSLDAALHEVFLRRLAEWGLTAFAEPIR